MTVPAHYDASTIGRVLDFPSCITVVREAMKAFSASSVPQPLRSITEVGEGKLLGLMPGLLLSSGIFGAKIISVFEDKERPGRSAHRGLVIVYGIEDGSVLCTADAEEITRIRTAAATAVATDALARKDASRLTVFGCGVQARAHILAIQHIRKLDEIMVWGRNASVATAFANALEAETGLPIRAEPDARYAAASADIICTVTNASEPILSGEWVRPGTHVNAVGSSRPGPVEVDSTLVVASRYVADSRRSALAAAAEFLDAKSAGLVGDDHIVAEIGEVLLGRVPGRTSEGEITLYKSLGHIVQDLSAAAYVHAAVTSVERA
jgi:ornithine cyclodeaminase